MKAVAAWLVARPLNSVLALAMSISLGPVLSLTSGAVLVLLILHKGVRRAATDIAMAGALTVVIGLLAKVPAATIIPGALGIWMPAMLLGTMLTVTRSITLTIQLSVIIAVLVLTVIFLVSGNPAEYWTSVLNEFVEALKEAQQHELAGYMEQLKEHAAGMTMAAVLSGWTAHTVAFVLGYRIYRLLPDVRPVYGRFRDLNLGRVIAVTMAVASVLGLVTGIEYLQNVAFVMFGVFWLQGLAIVHWLYGEQMMPRIGLVAAYVMLLSLVLSAVTMIGFAIFGYLDAWFRLRRQPNID